MKYDVEYDSYKFSNDDLDIVISSLYFYSQHSPEIDQSGVDYISGLIKTLESSKHITT